MNEPRHVERQTLAAWVHVALGLCLGGAVASALGARQGEDWWWGLIPIGLILVVYGVFSPMTVRVDGEEMIVTFGHFGWPRWRFMIREIRDARVVEFSPLRDYGGWGIRAGREGICLNQRGRRGVRFEHLGHSYLVGSDAPERLLAALAAAGADVRNAPEGRPQR